MLCVKVITINQLSGNICIYMIKCHMCSIGQMNESPLICWLIYLLWEVCYCQAPTIQDCGQSHPWLLLFASFISSVSIFLKSLTIIALPSRLSRSRLMKYHLGYFNHSITILPDPCFFIGPAQNFQIHFFNYISDHISLKHIHWLILHVFKFDSRERNVNMREKSIYGFLYAS